MEDLRRTAEREAFEETGLEVQAEQIAYIEEVTSPDVRHCKVWFAGRVVGGALHTTHSEAVRERIVEAAFLVRAEFDGKTIYPPMLWEQYWLDKETGFATPRYFAPRPMTSP